MANDLLSIFQFGFMQRALIAGLVIATVCGVLGVFVVLRRTAPLGDALAHVSFGGVAIGIAAGLFPIEMAILIAVLGGIGIRVLQERHLYGELSLTVIQAAGLGGGVVVISMVGGLNVEILSFLFGQILTVTWSDVALIVVLLAATILVLAVLYKEFFLLTFDPEGARVSGLPVRALDTGFTVLTAITIVLAMQVVGVLLVSALLAVPAAAALQLRVGLKGTMLASVFIGMLSVAAGLVLAVFLNAAAGGTIVLLCLAALFTSLLMAGRSNHTELGAHPSHAVDDR
ncbi:MAG: metal ABC transporter permease [Methanobacteriota archaeon]|nr:MAG: metal ABC transporter permease [Euryarchaeota archaeon]TMA04683.1 MAG: metal ABC transporter permease [Euryarchaeota archaeon]